MKKQTQAKSDRDPLPACCFCEHAKGEGDDPQFVFCTLKSLDIHAGGVCPSYTYDLLKRAPLRLRLTSHLDPALLNDTCDL